MDITSNHNLTIGGSPRDARSEPMSTAERFKHNRPTGIRQPGLRVWGFCVAIGLIVLSVVSLLIVSAAVAQGAEPAKPVLYVFKVPGCIPCKMLNDEICFQGGTLFRIANERFDVRYVPPGGEAEQAFLKAIPRKQQLFDLDGAGVRTSRPVNRIPGFPAVWVEGRADYWLGFARGTAVDLARYLDNAADNWKPTAQVDPQPFTRGILSEPTPTLATPTPTLATDEPDRAFDLDAGAITQAPEPTSRPLSTTGEAQETSEPSERTTAFDQDFDGVRVVVLVSSLSDNYVGLRTELARRANAVLQSIMRDKLGGRVDAFLISEVGDPDTFEQIVEIVGVRPGAGTATPVSALVLIPKRFEGLQGMIVGQVEQALASHYLPDLKRAGMMPILERIHGDTFDAVLAALDSAGGGIPPTDSSGILYLIATYLSERSKIGALIARRFGLVA